MTFNCRVYKNSGYNSVNIPDTPTLLDAGDYTDVNALDILQDRFLNSIRVKATWETVRDADYCRLTYNNWTWYYSVESVQMRATDVAELTILPDYINSVGGISALTNNILDGITERVHVSDDNYGEYQTDDSLLTPAEPLKINMAWFNTAESISARRTVIEATVNPIYTAKAKKNEVYTDDTGSYSVCVPQTVENEFTTDYYIDTTQSTYSPGTCLYPFYNVDSETQEESETGLNSSLAALRSLGLEQTIISEVALPSKFIDIETTKVTSSIYTDAEYYYISKATGKDITINTTGLDYVNTTAQNNLINYSGYCKYGIVSAAGESAEFNPDDIYDSSVTSPNVRCISDPHTNGKPYYRFETVNGDNSVSGFWRNCIAGMQWKQIPLIFTGASGSALNTLKFQNSQNIANINYNREVTGLNLEGQQAVANYAMSLPSQIFNVIGSAFTAVNPATSMGAAVTGAGGAVSGMLQSYSNAHFNAARVDNSLNYAQKGYAAARKSELTDLAINNNVVVPTVNFPYNSDVIRDTYGNGVLIYRYYYSDNDIARIDKLLTMYGYKHSKPLEQSDFTNRQYFNFVECNNITVKGFPRWINDGIADQLKAGVRIWHVAPDTAYYTNNPVKTA